MIFDVILKLGVLILQWVVEKLPTSVGFGTDFHTAMSTLGGYVEIWKPILPMTTLASVILIVMGVELAIFGFKTVKWIISHIPYVGGKGV